MAALSVDGIPMPALPNSADQINYNNTTSGLSATTVKGAVDELASEKQDKSDDSLQTTDKTIPGAINELKSGLMVKTKTLTPVSIAAGGYQSFEDADIKNVAIVGYWIGGVAGFNITVISILSDGSGLHLVIKNNGETAVTPSSISVKYL